MNKAKIIGVKARSYPDENCVCGVQIILAVLVAGGTGDYTCYAGGGSAEWVVRFGNKMSYAEACVHFPGEQLLREKYRE